MSDVISNLNQILVQLQRAFTDEKDRLEKNVDGVVKDMSRDTKREFDTVFDHIQNFMDTQGTILKSDFDEIETLFDNVAKKIELTADKAYNTFTKKTESEIKKIEDLTSDAIGKMELASEYIRNGAINEIRTAIERAKTTFENIKNTFKNDIATVSSDIVEKAREAIDQLKLSAENDYQRIDTLRKTVDSDIDTKFSDVKSLFVKIKNDAKSELDAISNLVSKEVDKLEIKIKNLKKEITQISLYLSIAALIIGFSAAMVIIAEKEKRATLKLSGRK